MTNHWNDIDNASLVFAFGANPAENHPACMAHINAARFGAKKARLIVVDPRLTRTARQIDPDRVHPADGSPLAGQSKPDLFVRIRPGTNVAFTNGLLNWILNGTNLSDYDATAAANMLAWHNGTNANFVNVARTFADDTGTTQTLTSAELLSAQYDGVPTTVFRSVSPTVAGYPKYCDSRFKVTPDGTDYQHARLTMTTGTAGAGLAKNFSGFPLIAAGVSDPDCVFQKLKAHVAAYTQDVVADICGCTTSDIVAVAQAIVDNSRFNSSDFITGAAANGATPQAPDYRVTTILYAMGQTQHTNGSQNIKDLAVIQTVMGNMGRPGGGINALRGIHNVQGSTDMGLLFDSIPGYSGNPAALDHYTHYSDTLFGNRVENHGVNTGAKDWRVASNLGLQQRGFHNMTQEWFGNGALDSAGQTSPNTNIEKLYRLWPKGNGVQHIQTFRYMTKLDSDTDKIHAAVVWGQNPAVTEPNQSKVRAGLKELDLLVVVDMYETETASCSRKSVADGGNRDGITYLIPACSHAEEAGSVTNSGRWLQWRERATAPKGNSKSDLELMLRFAYALDKAGAFAHMTNVPYNGLTTAVPTTGVWSTTTPTINGPAYWVLYGNKFGWTPTDAMPFEGLSGTIERWAPGLPAPANETLWGSEVVAEKVHIELCRPLNDTATSGGTMWIYSGNGNNASYYAGALLDIQPQLSFGTSTAVVDESVVLTGTATSNLANLVVMASPAPVVKSADGVTTYPTTAYAIATAGTRSTIARTTGSPIPDGATVLVSYTYNNNVHWLTKARAKSRDNLTQGAAGTKNAKNYPRWGFAWLLNRRVFYNNSEVAADVADVFVAPGVVCGLFTISSASTFQLADWSLLYRKYKNFSDQPSAVIPTDPGYNAASPHFVSAGLTFAGRFPGHTEPYESPRDDVVADFGHNMSGVTRLIVEGTTDGTLIGTATGSANGGPFPLVLTSIRCVEHFQGGPTTRNNSWNVEAEPVPWIEINSVDARAAVALDGVTPRPINDGDWVNVITARSNSTSDQMGTRSPNSGSTWARGFKARVGVGLQSNQRVAPGVVAIPWHWGDKGLSTGSRANDLCIDAWDANTMIPEYKACLCRIVKL
jgi:anaerobic selenocysteine-containing dehydrogenase